MTIDLMPVIDEEGREFNIAAAVSFREIKSSGTLYPIIPCEDISFVLKCGSDKKLLIHGYGRIRTVIPCDRCLAPVDTELSLDFTRTVHMKDEEVADWDEERSFIDGTVLDTDRLLQSEILIVWPVKTLCREDCLGICSKCGANRNIEPCSCEEESADPRMSVIRDIFNKYKEV